MHFKLLSCISQARARGITQSELAKSTKQDPRSFPMRTKLLVELGLMYFSSEVLMLILIEQNGQPFITAIAHID